MYEITEQVFNCYREIGKYKKITKETLGIRLGVNVAYASDRERIYSSENKWKYYFGNFVCKVDHDINLIYYIGWQDEYKHITRENKEKVRQEYVRYGLNRQGNLTKS